MYFSRKEALQALILVGTVVVMYTKAAPPRFLSQPKKYYKVYEGGKVKLRCAVTGANDPNHNRTLTAWKKDGVSPRNSIIRKSRIWKRFKVKNGKYLRIRNVKKEDTGTYWCIAKNQNGMIKADIHVQVIPVLLTNNTKSHYVTATIETQKPKPTVAIKIPRFRNKQTAYAIKKTKGELLRIPCHAKGTPRPKIKWRKNNRNLKKGKRVRTTTWALNIRKLKHSDSGVYQCFVWNQYGNITRTFFVQVIDDDIDPPSHTPDNGKPVIQKQLLKNATIKAGEMVTFSCMALSKLVPKFTWLKWSTFNHSTNATVKITVLNSSAPNVRFIRESSRWVGGIMSYSHKLKLLNVSQADQGQYTCIVGSAAGFVSSNVYLKVHPKRSKDPNRGPQGSTTSKSPNSMGGNQIPLAALIAVPAAFGTLLIVAIIWCYIQTIKHRNQLNAKAAMFAANGATMNGSCARPTPLDYGVPMETFINGHVIHTPIPGPEVRQQPEVTQGQVEVLEVNSTVHPRSLQSNAYSENSISLDSSTQQSTGGTNRSTTPRCHANVSDKPLDAQTSETTMKDTSTTLSENSSEVICVQEKPQDCSRTCVSDEQREEKTTEITCAATEENSQHDDCGVRNSVV